MLYTGTGTMYKLAEMGKYACRILHTHKHRPCCTWEFDDNHQQVN